MSPQSGLAKISGDIVLSVKPVNKYFKPKLFKRKVDYSVLRCFVLTLEFFACSDSIKLSQKEFLIHHERMPV